MATKIRLQRRGRKGYPFYHIVIADSRAPRDGKFIEKIGTYNPMTSPATINLDTERACEWLKNGAQPTSVQVFSKGVAKDVRVMLEAAAGARRGKKKRRWPRPGRPVCADRASAGPTARPARP